MSGRGRRSQRQTSPSPVRATRDVRAPTLKLPEFWDSTPAAWFAIVEAHFNKSNVTDDDDRYNHTVAMLGSSTAARVVGFLSAPPTTNKYEHLKALLLETFELSTAERVRRLFDMSDLGDERPSARMERMLNLLGAEDPMIVFTELFMRTLPAQVRMALANTTIVGPRALAKEADRFVLAMPQRSPDLLAPAAAPPQDRRKRAKDDAGPSGQQGNAAGHCFYHATFGTKAKRCRSPCTFGQTGNGRASAR